MKQLRQKENSLYPSRLRGRGAEVSKTLFYVEKLQTQCFFVSVNTDGVVIEK